MRDCFGGTVSSFKTASLRSVLFVSETLFPKFYKSKIHISVENPLNDHIAAWLKLAIIAFCFEMQLILAGGCKVVRMDTMCDNGVVHLMTKVAFSPGGTIANRIQVTSELSILLGAVDSAELADILDGKFSVPRRPYTRPTVFELLPKQNFLTLSLYYCCCLISNTCDKWQNNVFHVKNVLLTIVLKSLQVTKIVLLKSLSFPLIIQQQVFLLLVNKHISTFGEMFTAVLS